MITAPGCILPMRIGSLLVHVRSLLRREPLFSVLEVMREVNYDMVETGRKNSSPPPSSAQENSVSVPLPLTCVQRGTADVRPTVQIRE